MKEITVEKSVLIAKLKANRDAHREIFLEALDGYRKKAIEMFEAELDRARKGKHFNVYIQLTQPVDQTKDYDRVISMLEMDLKEKIELSEQDYRQYVLDDWGWKSAFLTSNSTYSPKALLAMDSAGQSQ